MTDRLDAIKHRTLKGYVNSHRWDDADSIPLGVDMLAYAENDIDWLLDEVERLRAAIDNHRGRIRARDTYPEEVTIHLGSTAQAANEVLWQTGHGEAP